MYLLFIPPVSEIVLRMVAIDVTLDFWLLRFYLDPARAHESTEKSIFIEDRERTKYTVDVLYSKPQGDSISWATWVTTSAHASVSLLWWEKESPRRNSRKDKSETKNFLPKAKSLAVLICQCIGFPSFCLFFSLVRGCANLTLTILRKNDTKIGGENN